MLPMSENLWKMFVRMTTNPENTLETLGLIFSMTIQISDMANEDLLNIN